MLIFLELIQRGYKLIVSTHSPVMLEALWALRFVQSKIGTANLSYLYNLFSLESSTRKAGLDEVFEHAMKADFRTYYFDRDANNQVFIKDISSLDPGDDDQATSEWGGLASLSSKANNVVSRVAGLQTMF